MNSPLVHSCKAYCGSTPEKIFYSRVASISFDTEKHVFQIGNGSFLYKTSAGNG